MSDNSIGDEGAKALAEVLEKNDTLTNINLMANGIEDEGVKALAEALKKNHTLTKINLSDNWIKDEGVEALCDSLEKNHTITAISLDANSLISYEYKEEIAKMLKDNMNNVQKVADFLVKRFITKDDAALKEEAIDFYVKLSKNMEKSQIQGTPALEKEATRLLIAKYLKDYQVVDKALLQRNLDKSMSNIKSSHDSLQTPDFAQLCKATDSFINKNYFSLANICKDHEGHEDLISSCPEHIREHIASFIGDHSLWTAAEANVPDMF